MTRTSIDGGVLEPGERAQSQVGRVILKMAHQKRLLTEGPIAEEMMTALMLQDLITEFYNEYRKLLSNVNRNSLRKMQVVLFGLAQYLENSEYEKFDLVSEAVKVVSGMEE